MGKEAELGGMSVILAPESLRQKAEAVCIPRLGIVNLRLAGTTQQDHVKNK
jgi:hypothetical protein